MFTLALLEDDIAVKPCFLGKDGEWELQLKREVQSKYVDRVIPNVGLCIEFYAFVKIKDAPVYPGDNKMTFGEAVFRVEFHVIVFQPRIGEWLVGSVSGSTTAGLRVSLGFFHDVLIPPSGLREPYVFDNAHKLWAWQFRDQESRASENLWYRFGELVRLRVTSVAFPDTMGPKGPSKTSTSAMQVIGAVDKDGLGCVSWWPNEKVPDMPAEVQGIAPMAVDAGAKDQTKNELKVEAAKAAEAKEAPKAQGIAPMAVDEGTADGAQAEPQPCQEAASQQDEEVLETMPGEPNA